MILCKDICRPVTGANEPHPQNEYLAALHETTLGLISRLNPTDLLQAIVNRAVALLGTSHGYAYLADPDGKMMQKRIGVGLFAEFIGAAIPPGVGVAGIVWETGRPLVVEKYQAWDKRLDTHAGDLLHAVVGIPLTSGTQVVGVIGLGYAEKGRPFGEQELAILNRFAQLASVALDNASLHEALQKELVERRRAEEALQQQLHFLQALIDAIPAPIYYKDPRGLYLGCNRAFEIFLGLPKDRIVGKTVYDVAPRDLADIYYEADQSLFRQPGLQTYESAMRYADGSRHDVIFYKATFQGPNGNLGGLVGTMLDITERKKLEAQLRHAQKIESVGRLAGGIAHDFNNIITAITVYASTLENKLAKSDFPVNSLEQIRILADKAANLTQGLLAFSRNQANNPQRVDCNEIVTRMGKLLTSLIGGIDLVIETWDNPLPVMADSVQIEQVLMNLATNARDAMPAGGKLTIRTGLEIMDHGFINTHGFGEQGSYALLSVSDTGNGMDEETKQHIFEPFFTTKAVGKGTGLGLSIVYGIVKQHNGFITVASAPKSGTSFTVYLPLIDTDRG